MLQICRATSGARVRSACNTLTAGFVALFALGLGIANGQGKDVPADLRDRVPIIGPDGRVPPGSLPPSMVDKDGRPVAQLHCADKRCSESEIADERTEPDVARRECFLFELSRKRILPACTWSVDWLTPDSARDIPEDMKETLLAGWLTFIDDKLIPADHGVVRWYGEWVHQATPNDPAGADQVLQSIVAEWAIDAQLIRFSQLAEAPRSCTLTVRFPRCPAVEFRRMPQDFEGYSSEWESVPRRQLDDLLAEFLRLDRAKLESLRLHGHITSAAGVDVYTGRLRWLPQPGSDGLPETLTVPSDPLPERLLITDSDPQYICVGFVFPR